MMEKLNPFVLVPVELSPSFPPEPGPYMVADCHLSEKPIPAMYNGDRSACSFLSLPGGNDIIPFLLGRFVEWLEGSEYAFVDGKWWENAFDNGTEVTESAVIKAFIENTK